MPPLPLAASCAHLFIPELVLERRPRQLPDACASHWQCDPNECGLPVLGTDASTEAAAAAAAPTEATCARHRRHATVSSASLRSPRGGWRLREGRKGRAVCLLTEEDDFNRLADFGRELGIQVEKIDLRFLTGRS
jgi:hypothetical protein